MKTEKQVRTWWISFGNPYDHVAWELPVDKNSTKVISHEDHLAIVAELEKRIQKFRYALEFYADGGHIINVDEEHFEIVPGNKDFMETSYGLKARNALEEDEKN